MNTWTSRRIAAALALALLGGCEDGQLPFATGGDPAAVALNKARMAFGSVTVVPPSGYCIDRATLKQRFAVMARCDALGAPSAAGFAPRGIILVSFASAGGQSTLPSPDQTAAALGLESVRDVRQADAGVTFRAQGPAPAEGLSDRHWRGTARVGDQIMGLALYAPSGGAAAGREGRDLLNEVIAQSEPVS